MDFEALRFTVRAVDCEGYSWTAFSKSLPGPIAVERCKFKLDPYGREVEINLCKVNADDSWWSLKSIELERPYTLKARVALRAGPLKSLGGNREVQAR